MTVNTQTGEIVEQLTAMERSALVHAEATIERGLTSFMEVGEALSKVRDAQLYREDFGTFEAYCRDRWGITDRRARQMIDAATITDALPPGTTVPVNEGQARELVGLPPPVAAEVMHRATEATNGRPTAAAIREARAPEPPPRPRLADDEDIQRASVRRANIAGLESVVTFLDPRTRTPRQMAESYADVLDAFDADVLDRSAATLTAITALKKETR